MYEWFVFDAKDFYELFYENKSFKDKFNQYNNNQLEGDKTKYFYEQIAAPEIEKLKDKINFTYLNIKNYENTNDNELVALYKFFSPVHLLKLSFANDANELNKEFYAELLHILGLEERKEGNKKLIDRKKEGNRDNGSIIENAIEKIDSGDKLDNLKHEQYGNTKDEQLFNVALDLVITWINRILFLKLLESQIVKYNQNNENFAFLSVEQLEGFNELYSLFFTVLARKTDERNDYLRNKFSHIPYLNSSLFEITDMENKTICIDSLHDNIKIKLYSQSVLKNKKGANISNTMRPLEYLLRFLDAYDFGSESSEDIQKENKPLISASVLGLIFEKINGYKDGSFFTPSFITMYMCRETISRAIIQKFNETKNWNCQTIIELHNKIHNKIHNKEANEIFNSVRICDPAVGSGHFLVSALNEMIWLKSELGILADKTGKQLIGYSITIERDELNIKKNGEIFQYDSRDPESRRVQETFFHEKQTIIENCLFGVDINPNSVKICQLRLWIELLKHTYYKQNTKELETLPNIDINIKCGNSLLSRFDLHDKYHDNPALQQKIRQATQNYKAHVALYKNVTDKAAKQQIKKQIETEKLVFYQINNAKDSDYQNLSKAKNELASHTNSFNFFETEPDKFDNKATELTRKVQEMEEQYNFKIRSCFEWRFEFPEVLDDDGNFVGFDVVIGNPPYVDYRDINIQQKETLFKYEIVEHSSKINLYTYFIEKGIKLLKEKGYIIFITPQQYLILENCKGVRDFVRKYRVISLSDFSNVKVFVDAETYPFISLIQNAKSNLFLEYLEFNSTQNMVPIRKLNLSNPISEPLCISDYIILIEKIERNGTNTINDFLSTDVFCASSSTLTTYSDNSKTGFVAASDIQKYYLNPIKTYIDKKRYSEQSIKKQKGNVIYTSRMTKTIRAFLSENNFYLGGKVNVIKVKKSNDEKFILALLNSKLVNFWYIEKYKMQHLQGGYLPINTTELKIIPIPAISLAEQQSIITIVDKIISSKKENPAADTNALEAEIDKLVYGLYGLTEEEIKIVEEK
jgi:hypothetical protein